ncbi:MAG: FemAB family XrtA/PEP-CTERM system-associated protein [Pseudomonadota bacterium]
MSLIDLKSAAVERPESGAESRVQQAVRVRAFSPDDAAAWDRFVEHECPEATFFHLSGWERVLRGVFGHRTHFLLAERGDVVVGVLPLAEVKSLLFGHSLISTPFCVYGGVAALDGEVREALTHRACELAGELRVEYLELRNQHRRNPDWPCKDLYVTFRREIAADDEENLKAIPRKQRAMVRKGIKKELQATADNDLTVLYDCYSQSVRNLGTPVFSVRYLHKLQEVFGPERCRSLTVRSGDTAVAAVMSFYFRDQVLPYYGGGKESARHLYANDFMYWSVMRDAARSAAVRVFDYGRSKVGTGSYDFKRHWGFEPTPLYYEYHLVRAKSMPNLSPTNPKYRLFISAWKRLPNALARRIGPLLARSLG